MRVSIERNGASDSPAPYNIHIQLTTTTVDLETNFYVPMYARPGSGLGSYVANICGFQVKGETPEAATALIERLVSNLINFGRLPTYIFIARRSYKMYPVYTQADEVFATTPGGPLFKHVELAKVREYLSDYLHDIGALGVPGKSEKLHVRGVHRITLDLIRPIFYLKKRPQTSQEYEFWAPVFPADDEGSIYTYAASGKREVDMAGGYEVLLLRSQVAQALIADKRLKDIYNLRVDRLLPDYYQQVKPTFEDYPAKLKFGDTVFDVYRSGKTLIAVEYRSTEDRYSLYLGRDLEDLRDRAAKDLARRDLLSNISDLQIAK
jgi:hypothetical protein